MQPASAADPASLETLAEVVRAAAARWPDRIAWIFDQTGEQLTYADVDRRTDALAALLVGLGVHPGDRVAVMLGNRPEFPLCWLALAKLGVAMVPVNTNYRQHDATHVLAHAQCRTVLSSLQFIALLESVRELTALQSIVDLDSADLPTLFDPLPAQSVPETIANVQYSSGTTGTPKGCLLPNRYWTRLASGLIRAFPFMTQADVILTAQPFHYMDPQWNVVLGLMSGARLVVLDRFHPTTFWAKVREHEVTWFYCLGLMPKLMLDMPTSPADRKHRVRAVCASAIPPDLHAALETRWDTPWFEAFGMTETGSDIRLEPADHDEVVGTGCLGRPVDGREAMIMTADGEPAQRGVVGELVLRGLGMMHGYFRDPTATSAAYAGGWFHTGDLARMDDEGRVFYVGRSKDMIRRSGENVSATEVEAVLQNHPRVELATVLAVADDLRGHEILAVVVATEDGPRPDPRELAAYVGGRLAYFKVPRWWTFRERLPMTASERVAKAALRDELDADVTGSTFDVITDRWT
jgi:carnitine-CoA ligase